MAPETILKKTGCQNYNDDKLLEELAQDAQAAEFQESKPQWC